MAIKCGRCSCYHESVADVKACCAGGRVAVLDPPATATKRAGKVSDKQWKFLNSLRAQLGLAPLPDTERDGFTTDKNGTGQFISDAISDLLCDVEVAKQLGTWVNPYPETNTGVPRHAQQADWPTIKAGYYAIPSLTGNQDLDFFRVDAPDDGNWKGFLFVKRVLGGGADSLRTERVHRSTADQVLTVLIPPFAAQAARERFGQEIGRCGCCGRSLTDETSRARGIGPDCWAKS